MSREIKLTEWDMEIPKDNKFEKWPVEGLGVWCCDGDGNGNHAKSCRHSEKNCRLTTSQPEITPSVSTGEVDRFYCVFCDLRIYQDKNDVLFPNSWRHHGSNAITSEYPDRHHAKPKEQSGEVAKLEAKDAEIAKLEQTIADQKKRIAALERNGWQAKES